MIIKRVMTKNPIFIHPSASLNEARALMDKEKIGRLPVLDMTDKLVGIVTKKDLIKAGPSPATTLDIYEISYLLAKLKVDKIMVRPVITVDEDEVVEEAARIMADEHIGCLPVMRKTVGNPIMVGIITDTDLFRVFVKVFGARHVGVRIAIIMDEKPGQLAKLTKAIADRGGNIVSFATSDGDDPTHLRGTMKLTGLSLQEVEHTLRAIPDIVLEDIRE